MLVSWWPPMGFRHFRCWVALSIRTLLWRCPGDPTAARRRQQTPGLCYFYTIRTTFRSKIKTPYSDNRHLHAYDVTNGVVLVGVNRVLLNPAINWLFRHKQNGNLLKNGRLLTRFLVGKVTPGITYDEIGNMLQKEVKVPQKYAAPAQNFVT
ncbi:hypothetical protein N7509_008073 [Penicillium cosmopolitanum]|uniref:Uncharacterized protein n=1 Tax=Penicillium cosmopolitanum TaxID=1131564 RepID=A0A9W9W025_9EURO|nr:uncharacterized protein N7509_008073 [Penicillium cosmopolitanum]KAJ5392583.1 hypothetical protein N7509_008073 [Penicillium cosmopolitanum]